jgi:DNA (cytosine-5)-methyltransferase 1
VRVLDLFSGIGGFSLGLERAGMRTVAFCECDAWCRAVLGRHWPGVPCYEDVRELSGTRLRIDGIGADLIAGGFPCQDISVAGLGRGIDGARSGLWAEYARIVGDVRPQFAIVENVGALTSRGLARILGDFAALGYDAQWHAVPAAAVGAPHLRDRVWIVAADADGERLRQHEQRETGRRLDIRDCWHAEPVDNGAARTVADAARERMERHGPDRFAVAFAQACARLLGRDDAGAFWKNGPPVAALRGVDDGIPARLDKPRLAGLGNAVVPQLVEIIGRALMDVAA